MSPARKTGSEAPHGLDPDSRLAVLATMRLAREWDLRFETLLRAGRIGKWYSAVGNEALTVSAAWALGRGDALATLHRDVGALFARRVDVRAVFGDLVPAWSSRRDPTTLDRSGTYLFRLACQMLGREQGFTGGFDRSYHFVDMDDECTHVGMISHLGAMIPVAAGLAFAQGHRAAATASDSRVTLNFIGDGGTSTGDFHEALNMAAVWKLPFILVIENNRFAFSTPEREQYACAALADRAPGYGIAGERIDGNDPVAVFASLAAAVARARAGKGPTLIEAMLGRMRGHAEADGSLDLVPGVERERFSAADPLRVFEARLVESGELSPDLGARLEERAARIIDEALDRAERSPRPAPGLALGRAVFASSVDRRVECSGESTSPLLDSAINKAEEISYIEAIRHALHDELARDESVCLLGQDVAEFGGAFRATAGLAARFGRERVRNTPIAESGAIGIAIGAALLGLRPIVEMQFADFVTCGFNQLANVAAKIFYRWRRPIPLVIRLPYGGGVGAGPFHSQCPEGLFAQLPGLKIAVPASVDDAYALLRSAIRDPNPVLYFEHKYLYRRVKGLIDRSSPCALGRAVVSRRGQHATIVSYGWMLHRALEASEQLALERVSVEVVDLRCLVPLDREVIRESIGRTSRLLIVHEATRNCGFGAEIAAWIADEAFELLDAPVRRLTFPDTPVPFEKGLEAACLPSVEAIVSEIRLLLEY